MKAKKRTWTIYGYYPESDEVVIDEIDAPSPREAALKFFRGNTRQDGCAIVGMLRGKPKDYVYDAVPDGHDGAGLLWHDALKGKGDKA